MDLSNLSGNWKKLQATLAKPSSSTGTINTTGSPPTPPHSQHELKHNSPNHSRKRKRPDHPHTFSSRPPTSRKKIITKPMTSTTTAISSTPTSTSLRNIGLNPSATIGTYVALDCEMVGLAPSGIESILARVSIVNYDGECIYDSYVLPRPGQQISDFRTDISGIRPRDMRHARPFVEVQRQVKEILQGRIAVGHALRHDWAVLGFEHPREDVRDTCKHRPYRKLVGGGTPGLKLLTSMVLGVQVQEGEHCSLEDARAAMVLFRRDKDKFVTEGEMRRKKNIGRRGKWK